VWVRRGWGHGTEELAEMMMPRSGEDERDVDGVVWWWD
jgi:hypothetical protein